MEKSNRATFGRFLTSLLLFVSILISYNIKKIKIKFVIRKHNWEKQERAKKYNFAATHKALCCVLDSK